MELLFESRTNLGGFSGHLNFIQHKPRIHPEPVLVPDTFADGAGVSIYGSVLNDGGRLRMWYHAIPKDWDYQRDMSSIAYAESADGQRNRRPADLENRRCDPAHAGGLAVPPARERPGLHLRVAGGGEGKVNGHTYSYTPISCAERKDSRPQAEHMKSPGSF